MINTGGKVLEKLLIKRIMHHLHKTEFLNDDQYGFTPQKNKIDVAMEARKFKELQLKRGRVVIFGQLGRKSSLRLSLVAINTKRTARRKVPPKPLPPHTRLPKGRKAFITINSFSIEKSVTKGCPQGFWNIQ